MLGSMGKRGTVERTNTPEPDMVKRMTSWTLNLVLAAMAAGAVLLPSPDEIRKALEYGQAKQVVAVSAPEPATRSIEVRPAAHVETAAYEIEVPVAGSCLRDLGEREPAALSRCIPSVVRQIERFDDQAAAMKLRGFPVYPDPEIEEKRLALVNLCRAAWSAGSPVPGAPTQQQCQAVTVGVAY